MTMTLNFKVKKEELYALLLMLYLFVKLDMFGHNIIYYGSDYLMLLLAGMHLMSRKQKNKNKDYNHFIWYTAFFTYCFISRIWAIDHLYSKEVLEIMFNLLITIFVLLEFITDYNSWRMFLKILLGACVLHAIYSLVSTPLGDYGTNMFGSATGFHFNHIAQMLMYGICIALYFLYETKSKIYIGIAVFLGVIIAITGSRKAFVLSVAAVVIFLLFSKQRTLKRIKQVLLFIIIAMIGYYFVMTNDFLYAQIGSRLAKIFAIFSVNGGEADFSVLERLYFINSGLELFRQHPLIGVGVNNFKAYVGGLLGTSAKYSHNNYVEILSCLGICGFVLYYSAYVNIVVNFIRYVRKRSNEDLLVMIMMLLLIILEFGSVTYYFVQYQIVLIVICGYIRFRKKMS